MVGVVLSFLEQLFCERLGRCYYLPVLSGEVEAGPLGAGHLGESVSQAAFRRDPAALAVDLCKLLLGDDDRGALVTA